MEPPNNSVKWMTFSGLAEDYPTWSNRFSAIAKTRCLFEMLRDAIELPDRPALLREDAKDAQTREDEVQTQARSLAVRIKVAKITSCATWH